MPDGLAPAPTVASRARRVYLAGEYATLFLVLPGVIAFADGRLPLFVLLGGAFTACMAMLLLDRSFDRRRLWNAAGLASTLPGMLGLWALIGGVLSALVLWGRPEVFLYLPREHPAIYGAILVLYPLLSVYPQNVVYRVFVFHRYRELFRDRVDMIFASAAAFAWAHVIFQNVVALLLTALGGLIFARTYARTGSALAASVEHSLYGLLVFTVGLGWYVYLGSVR